MFSHFFIDRPIFATVISTVIVVLGLWTVFQLPVAQYPEIAPPTVEVKTTYPGADAQTVSDTVASEIEKEVNGVEGMIYMSSNSTSDGQYTLTITFEVGTDLDMAQVLVQNRVAIALAKLPEEVKRQGVTTKKKSASLMMAVNLVSPDGSRDLRQISEFATLRVKDVLARIQGVGDVVIFGERETSMRIWLDPERLAALELTASDIADAIREQNVQVAAGRLGQPPIPADKSVAFQYTLNAKGRLLEVPEFEAIIVKSGEGGRLVRLGDVARVELAAKNYDMSSTLDGRPTITLGLFQLPGSNAIDTAEEVYATMGRLAERFPSGLDYEIAYDTTGFIEESVRSVVETLFEAVALVLIVLLVFLQDWRATVIPAIAVPVSLIGTLAVMGALGFSLNNLSLFGLVLAIGIVVDDAIVVVENVDRKMGLGLPPKEAAKAAMTEVFAPVIATTLVLIAVFVPTALITGITGQFYRQFALTIAAATIISSINALTLSPALCGVLLKPRREGERAEPLPRLLILLGCGLAGLLTVGTWFEAPEGLAARLGLRLGLGLVGVAVGFAVSRLINGLLSLLFAAFNRVLDVSTALYARVIGLLAGLGALVMLVYGGLIALTYVGFQTVPTGFIPVQDKGYLVVNAQLPDAASLERTEAVVDRIVDEALAIPGVSQALAIPGYSALSSSNASNVGTVFVILEPFDSRRGDPSRSSYQVEDVLRKRTRSIQDAIIVAFQAPPVDGLGSTGGFKLLVQDQGGLGPELLQGMTANLIERASAQPGVVGLFSPFRADVPRYRIEIDRTLARSTGVPLTEVFNALQIEFGSLYVNDFTYQSRNWQVIVQADAEHRLRPEDIGRVRARNTAGDMVPLETLVEVELDSGPSLINRYNMFPSAAVNGNAAPGTSSGEAIAIMDQLARQELPDAMSISWTDLAYQQIAAAADLRNLLVFPLAVLFVFLVLAAQYESWSLPMAVILIVPMCLLCALAGVALRGMDNNIFTQIAFVVLVGLATKNAILIVEFAKEKREAGASRVEAAVEAARQRLRAILMTALTFILGVIPLVTAEGAGAEMRRAVGTAIFAGMLGVSFFGLFLTPVFFVLVDWVTNRDRPRSPEGPATDGGTPGS